MSAMAEIDPIQRIADTDDILRLPFDRRVMTHLALLLVATVAVETGLTRAKRAPVHVGGVTTHALILLVSGYNSRRVRREIVGEWSERRAQARDQLRMRGELQFAREMQLSMLPESPPSLPWIDVAGISIPATESGGRPSPFLGGEEFRSSKFEF